MPVLFIIPDDGVKPDEAKMAEAVELQAALAGCEVRLFDETIPTLTEGITLAELDAAEAVFSGYTAGGNTIAAFGDPYTDPDGPGVLLVPPTTQFNFATPVLPATPVTGTVGGYYVVDANGDLRGAVKFETNRFMSSDVDSIPIVAAFRVE